MQYNISDLLKGWMRNETLQQVCKFLTILNSSARDLQSSFKWCKITPTKGVVPMDRKEFIREMDIHLKLVRTEYGYTQELMASILGLSKKTLVEIEKGRSSLGWMGAVAFSSLPHSVHRPQQP